MGQKGFFVASWLVVFLVCGCASSPEGSPPPAPFEEEPPSPAGLYRIVRLSAGAPPLTAAGTLTLDDRGVFRESGSRATLGGPSGDEPYHVGGEGSLGDDGTIELVPTAGERLEGFATAAGRLFVCAHPGAASAALCLGVAAGTAMTAPTGAFHIVLLTRHTAWLATAAGTIVFTGDRYEARGTVTHSGDGFGDNLHFSFQGGFVRDASGWLLFDKLWRGALAPAGDIVLLGTVSDPATQEIGICLKAAPRLEGTLEGSYRGAWLRCDDPEIASPLGRIAFSADGTLTIEHEAGETEGRYTLGPGGTLDMILDGGETVTGAVDPTTQVVALAHLGDAGRQRIGVLVRE